jgi:hypothetical protein
MAFSDNTIDGILRRVRSAGRVPGFSRPARGSGCEEPGNRALGCTVLSAESLMLPSLIDTVTAEVSGKPMTCSCQLRSARGNPSMRGSRRVEPPFSHKRNREFLGRGSNSMLATWSLHPLRPRPLRSPSPIPIMPQTTHHHHVRSLDAVDHAMEAVEAPSRLAVLFRCAQPRLTRTLPAAVKRMKDKPSI